MTASVHKLERIVRTNAAGIPPRHNLDLERDLLAQVLNRPEVFDQVSDITKPEHFYHEFHARIWETAVELASVGLETSAQKVRNIMHARKQFAAEGAGAVELLAASSAFILHVEQMATELRDIWRVRALGDRCARIAAECHGDVGPIQEYLERVEGEVAELGRIDDAGSSVTVLESIRSVMRRIQETAGQQPGVPTGLRCLDEYLLGLHPGELTLVAGRPGMGKTALMMQMVTSIAGAKPKDGIRDAVIVFSLEMEHEQLSTRTMCSMARVDSKMLRAGRVNDMGWRDLTEAATWLGKSPITFDDKPAPSPLQIRSKCRRIKAKLEREGIRLAAVFVDYIQLVDGRPMVSKNASREECVAACSRSFKGLAKELGVPVVAGAQLNRPQKGKVDRPSLTDLRESGSLEQDADNVIFIHRPEYYLGERTPAELRGIAELIVAKQRNGDTGIARSRFYPRYTLFADLEPS